MLPFTFQRLSKADVLIYDRVGAEYILRALAGRYSVSILDVRKSSINFYPFFCFRVLKRLIRGVSPSRYLSQIAGIRGFFEFAAILYIDPKVVITYIDNSARFNLLSRTVSDVKFLGVQNGFRGIEVAEMAGRLKMTNFLCFGNETIDRYTESGCNIGNFIITGSLKDGLYRESRREVPEKTYDFCWISQFRPSRFFKTMPHLRETSELMANLLERYCLEREKKLVIACSCKEKLFAHEFAYLLKLFDRENIQIVPNDDYNFSSYRVIDQSEVSLTVHSTIGLESLSRGNKVIFCNFSGDPYLDIPGEYSEGIWAMKSRIQIEYEEFSRRLDLVYKMSRDQWQRETQYMGNYFITNTENCLPQEILRQEIESVL